MNPTTLYVVVGECGFHPEDYSRWDVCIYADKVMAEEHARLATEFYALAEKRRLTGVTEKVLNPYDMTDMSCYYFSGASFSVVELKQYLHIDQYLEAHNQ